jgi:charged multivesicular body protein 6
MVHGRRWGREASFTQEIVVLFSLSTYLSLMLYIYFLQIQDVLDRERQIARIQLERGNRQLALLCLKKRKFQEGLFHKTEQQLLNLESLTQTIEFSLIERQIFEGLRVGNEILKTIHNEMSLDNVQKLMDETQEAVEYQQVRLTIRYFYLE